MLNSLNLAKTDLPNAWGQFWRVFCVYASVMALSILYKNDFYWDINPDVFSFLNAIQIFPYSALINLSFLICMMGYFIGFHSISYWFIGEYKYSFRSLLNIELKSFLPLLYTLIVMNIMFAIIPNIGPEFSLWKIVYSSLYFSLWMIGFLLYAVYFIVYSRKMYSASYRRALFIWALPVFLVVIFLYELFRDAML